MSFASKFNKGKRFDIDVTGFTSYYSLSSLFHKVGEGHIYPVRAIFINTKGKYGEHPQVATDSYFVSLPSHMTAVCKEILADTDSVATINRGSVGFKVYEYTTPNAARPCYAVEWVDLPNGWNEDAVEMPQPDGVKKPTAESATVEDDSAEVPFD